MFLNLMNSYLLMFRFRLALPARESKISTAHLQYDTSKSRNVLGIVNEDKIVTEKDSVESFKAEEWTQ